MEDYEEYSDEILDEFKKSTDKLYDKLVLTDKFKQLSESQQEETCFIIDTFTDYIYSYYTQLIVITLSLKKIGNRMKSWIVVLMFYQERYQEVKNIINRLYLY